MMTFLTDGSHFLMTWHNISVRSYKRRRRNGNKQVWSFLTKSFPRKASRAEHLGGLGGLVAGENLLREPPRLRYVEAHVVECLAATPMAPTPTVACHTLVAVVEIVQAPRHVERDA